MRLGLATRHRIADRLEHLGPSPWARAWRSFKRGLSRAWARLRRREDTLLLLLLLVALGMALSGCAVHVKAELKGAVLKAYPEATPRPTPGAEEGASK